MKNINENTRVTNKSETKAAIEIRKDDESINITVNQRSGTFELSKEIRNIFRSIVPTPKLILIDLSKMDDIRGSFRLIIINMLLACKNNGVNLKIVRGRENI